MPGRRRVHVQVVNLARTSSENCRIREDHSLRIKNLQFIGWQRSSQAMYAIIKLRHSRRYGRAKLFDFLRNIGAGITW